MQFNQEQTYELMFFNAFGQTIFSEAGHATKLDKTISLEGYKSGIYFLKIRTDDKVHQQKILKQ